MHYDPSRHRLKKNMLAPNVPANQPIFKVRFWFQNKNTGGESWLRVITKKF
jgi:hypothetical protein